MLLKARLEFYKAASTELRTEFVGQMQANRKTIWCKPPSLHWLITESNLSNDAELWAVREGQRVEGKNVLANQKPRTRQRECKKIFTCKFKGTIKTSSCGLTPSVFIRESCIYINIFHSNINLLLDIFATCNTLKSKSQAAWLRDD